MLKAYFDDSGTHNGSAVIAAGGFVAKAEEWDVFEREWSEMLEVEEIGWFHTVFGMKMRGRDLAVDLERKDPLEK